MSPNEILQDFQHRPFSIPEGWWIMEQTWEDLLFAHWPADPERIKPLLPERLELDIYNGEAWITISTFKMRNSKLRGLPPFPGVSDFLELNIRTYVTYKGKPGIYFFSLDASSQLSVWGGKLGASLPYHVADMSCVDWSGQFIFSSKRKSKKVPEAKFKCSYKPVSDVYSTERGSLDAWLTERYCLFTQPLEKALLELDIHHKKWPLQKAEASIEENTLFVSDSIVTKDNPPFFHFSKQQQVLLWAPKIHVKKDDKGK